MSIISKAWKLQYKIETKINYFIKRNGKFTIALFGFSIITLGLVEIFYFIEIFGDATQINKQSNLFLNPVIHLFLGVMIFILLILNKKGLI